MGFKGLGLWAARSDDASGVIGAGRGARSGLPEVMSKGIKAMMGANDAGSLRRRGRARKSATSHARNRNRKRSSSGCVRRHSTGPTSPSLQAPPMGRWAAAALFRAWNSPAKSRPWAATSPTGRSATGVMCSGAGGYAEYAVTDYLRALPIPEGFDFDRAATPATGAPDHA